jgi:predicted RNA-binding Zn-ribbon protein involved in translation (DUF1610 family)
MLKEENKKATQICPNCGSETVYRSRRRGKIERLLRILTFVPIRCESCWNRFFLRVA